MTTKDISRYNRGMDTALAAANFARWEQALLSGDPRTVAALYAENGTLLPTMAQKVITDRAGAEEYFAFFLTFRPRVRMVEEQLIAMGPAHYLHCGVYRFTLAREEQEETLDARFTMVWERHGETWRILHHHSSRVPAG